MNRPHRLAAALFAALVLAAPGHGWAQGMAPLAPGSGEQVAVIGGKTLKVSTYLPKNCSPKLLLAVFHGTDRNADTYRDRARPLADKLCAALIAPEFSYSSFPRNLYAYGGMDEGAHTVDFVEPLIAWANAGLKRSDLPHVLIGHSAGGQFLSRVAAYTATGAARIVIENPSSWVMANLTDSVPFGFAGFKGSGGAEPALKLYLARPIIVAVGQQDTGSKELDQSIEARKQGASRHERGMKTYNTAKALAESHNWPFNWTLIEVEGVGHSSTQMMNTAQVVTALKTVGR